MIAQITWNHSFRAIEADRDCKNHHYHERFAIGRGVEEGEFSIMLLCLNCLRKLGYEVHDDSRKD